MPARSLPPRTLNLNTTAAAAAAATAAAAAAAAASAAVLTCCQACPGSALTPPVNGGLSLTPLTPVVDLSFPPICAEDGTPKYEYSNYYNTYVPSKLISQMPEMVYYVGLSQVTVRGRVDSPVMGAASPPRLVDGGHSPTILDSVAATPPPTPLPCMCMSEPRMDQSQMESGHTPASVAVPRAYSVNDFFSVSVSPPRVESPMLPCCPSLAPTSPLSSPPLLVPEVRTVRSSSSSSLPVPEVRVTRSSSSSSLLVPEVRLTRSSSSSSLLAPEVRMTHSSSSLLVPEVRGASFPSSKSDVVAKGSRSVSFSSDGTSQAIEEASGADHIESGSSTVAIDNKIEQAMDLVKSHLMYAVREEVEVLKEQIKELTERIAQLEIENAILKAAASPETLLKLPTAQSQVPPPASSSS